MSASMDIDGSSRKPSAISTTSVASTTSAVNSFKFTFQIPATATFVPYLFLEPIKPLSRALGLRSGYLNIDMFDRILDINDEHCLELSREYVIGLEKGHIMFQISSSSKKEALDDLFRHLDYTPIGTKIESQYESKDIKGVFTLVLEGIEFTKLAEHSDIVSKINKTFKEVANKYKMKIGQAWSISPFCKL